jgi:hypothetical protein
MPAPIMKTPKLLQTVLIAVAALVAAFLLFSVFGVALPALLAFLADLFEDAVSPGHRLPIFLALLTLWFFSRDLVRAVRAAQSEREL